jgi:crotonobetaine/carnitine-CoA ligase
MQAEQEQALTAPIMVKGKPAQWHDTRAMLRDKARLHGDKVFAVIDGRALSYVEMDRLSDCVGANLAARGIGEGDCVASMMFNCAEQVLAWFGANKIGAIWAPFNASLTGDDFAYTLRDSGARVLIVDQENAGKLASLPADVRASLSIFVVGGGSADADDFERLLAQSPAPVPEIALGPQTPALILYSGGTTGMPKGIVLPQFAMICVGYRYGEVLAVSAADHHYTTLPLFHASGTQLGILGPLINDMTVTMDKRFSVSGYWQRVRASGATIIDPIGTMMSALVQEPESAQDRQHKVRITTGVNGQIPPHIPQAFTRRFGIPIVDIYGNSESGGAMLTSNQLGAQAEGSVGHPNGWSQIAILDEHDNCLPPGKTGKIVLRPTIPFSFMLGYHNNHKKTAETWRNLWLHTGDLGRIDDAGYLFFVGRELHWIRRRGENISAYEIESIISQHPGVKECIVMGVPSELGEEDVKAWIIAGAVRPSEEELVNWCITRMAPFKVPRFFEFTDSFPRSAAKQEVERGKLKPRGNENAWDRERHMGRLSGQSAGRPNKGN